MADSSIFGINLSQIEIHPATPQKAGIGLSCLRMDFDELFIINVISLVIYTGGYQSRAVILLDRR